MANEKNAESEFKGFKMPNIDTNALMDTYKKNLEILGLINKTSMEVFNGIAKLQSTFVKQMISDFGVMLPDGPSQFSVIRDKDHYVAILKEGRNRQIRRTFAALGYTVTKLHRTQFGKYQLADLKSGRCVIIEP